MAEKLLEETRLKAKVKRKKYIYISPIYQVNSSSPSSRKKELSGSYPDPAESHFDILPTHILLLHSLLEKTKN